jgi:hypothetical protein
LVVHQVKQAKTLKEVIVPQRLAHLLIAIRQEQDPAVRGRAAALLLRDLEAAPTAARSALDDAVRELRRSGLADDRIAGLLDLPEEIPAGVHRR